MVAMASNGPTWRNNKDSSNKDSNNNHLNTLPCSSSILTTKTLRGGESDDDSSSLKEADRPQQGQHEDSNTRSNNGQGDTTANVDATESAGLVRAQYVKSILSRRLEYVQRGKRRRDLAKWVMQQTPAHAREGSTTTIVSTHGVELNNNPTTAETISPLSSAKQQQDQPEQAQSPPKPTYGRSTKKQQKRSTSTSRENDPFPANRMNLGIDDDNDAGGVRGEHSSMDSSKGIRQQEQGQEKWVGNNEDHYYSVSTPSPPEPTAFQLICRAACLSWHFAPVWSTVGLAYIIPDFRQRVWYPWLAKCIANSGAAFIKWGQWSSTRNDMFPDAFCDHLRSLHNDAPAHEYKFTHQQIEESLGLQPDTLHHVFDVLDPQPLASGSIAQVHRAVLDQQ